MDGNSSLTRNPRQHLILAWRGCLRRGGTASREARRNDDTTRFHTKRFVFGPPIGRPLRSEPLSGSNRDAGPHQAVAQLDPEQILLRLRAAVTYRVQQNG